MVKRKFINDPRIASAALHQSAVCFAPIASAGFLASMGLAPEWLG